MTSALTVVYHIEDQEAFSETREKILGTFEHSLIPEDPLKPEGWKITAVSNDDEVTRIDLLEELFDSWRHRDMDEYEMEEVAKFILALTDAHQYQGLGSVIDAMEKQG
jgi:hypothetical protein